jgi:gliding motility-associated-like protein
VYGTCPTVTKSFNFLVDPIPVITITPTTSDVCEGTLLPLTASISPSNYPYSYTWSNDLSLINENTLSPTFIGDSTKYIRLNVTTNDANCKDADSILINVYEYAQGTCNPFDTIVCGGQDCQLLATSNTNQYLWYPNIYISCTNCPNPVVNPPDKTTYYVVLVHPFGCNDTLQSTVKINPPFNLTLHNNDTTIEYGDNIWLHASGAYHYNWTPQQYLSSATVGLVQASPLFETTYVVIGTDTFNQCPKRDSVTIKIAEDPTYIPSIFSPNGDGLNDVFRIGAKGYIILHEFRVYNRFGQEVFAASNITDGWDGRFNGEPCDTETYFYMAKYVFPSSGKVREVKGQVVLTR